MNDVLINNDHILPEYTCQSTFSSLTEKCNLDPSSCEFCGDVVCYNTCKDSQNFSFGNFRGELKKDDNNYQKLYKKDSLRKYLIGGITEESQISLNDSDNECLICYDEKGLAPIVHCSLCSKFVHYKCYKKFTKKNKFYTMKCVQCGTRSLQFTKKCWQSWCCF